MVAIVGKLIAAAAGALVGAAVAKELEKPSDQRGWHGEVGGVPYDFRRPTADKLRRSAWDPDNPEVFVPHAFGVGWSINFARLAEWIQPPQATESAPVQAELTPAGVVPEAAGSAPAPAELTPAPAKPELAAPPATTAPPAAPETVTEPGTAAVPEPEPVVAGLATAPEAVAAPEAAAAPEAVAAPETVAEPEAAVPITPATTAEPDAPDIPATPAPAVDTPDTQASPPDATGDSRG